MKPLSSPAKGGFGTGAAALGVLVWTAFATLTVATLHDFFQFAGAAPIALGFYAPAAYLVLRCALPRLLARNELQPDQAP